MCKHLLLKPLIIYIITASVSVHALDTSVRIEHSVTNILKHECDVMTVMCFITFPAHQSRPGSQKCPCLHCFIWGSSKRGKSDETLFYKVLVLYCLSYIKHAWCICQPNRAVKLGTADLLSTRCFVAGYNNNYFFIIYLLNSIVAVELFSWLQHFLVYICNSYRSWIPLRMWWTIVEIFYIVVYE